MTANEHADAILSDDTVVDLLKQEGLGLARLTVANYLEAIRFDSSAKRRRQRVVSSPIS